MRQLRSVLAALAYGAVLTGCSITIPMARPTPSGLSFSDPSATKVTLKVVDGRAGQEMSFHVLTAGLSSANVRLDGIDAPVMTLADNLANEVAGRGYPVKVVTDPSAAADVELRVTRYRIVSREIPGFGPWEAMHQFRGTLTAGSKQRTVYAYFFNSKMPLLGAKDVYDPCFNLPQSILVKEIVSRVNHAVLGFRSSDAAVDELIKRARSKNDIDNGPYMEIVELGGTNNPKAMDVLKQYASHRDEFVRAVAFDAIGMLGPEKELGFLKDRFVSPALTGRDRYMALKAIGDAGDEESLKFVSYQTSHKDYDGEAGMRYLVDLYSGR